MKKTFIWQLLMLLIPFGAFAQNAPIINNFLERSESFNTIKIDDGLYVGAATFKNNVAQISAINSNMQILWRSGVQGVPIACGLFKQKIYVVVSSPGTDGKSMLFCAFFLDRSNGKVLNTKIFQTTDMFAMDAKVFSGAKGDFLKIVLRTTGASVKESKRDKKYLVTTALSILTINEALEFTTTKLPLSDGLLTGINGNSEGALFFSWMKPSGQVDIEKYSEEKRIATIGLAYDIKDGKETKAPASFFYTMPSAQNPDLIYQAIAHDNAAGDRQLSIGKVNFTNNTKQVASSPLTKDVLKTIKKGYVEINKKLRGPDAGDADWLKVVYMGEDADNVVVTLSAVQDGEVATFTPAFQSINGQSRTTFKNEVFYPSPLIFAYDKDLKIKTQHIFPATYYFDTQLLRLPGAVCHISNGSLYVAANYVATNLSAVLYGKFDLKTQQWVKQELLPKNNLPMVSVVTMGQFMWFNDGFIVPYMTFNLMARPDFALQYNKY